MANNFTGRQIIINTTGLINIQANMKVVDAWWQDVTTAGHIFTFTDAAGRTFTFTAYQPNYPFAIGKLDWLEGPITVTALGSGTVYFILGNK
jgi:hypothetical protein